MAAADADADIAAADATTVASCPCCGLPGGTSVLSQITDENDMAHAWLALARIYEDAAQQLAATAPGNAGPQSSAGNVSPQHARRVRRGISQEATTSLSPPDLPEPASDSEDEMATLRDAPMRVLPYYEIHRGHPAFDPDATVTMQEAHTWAQAAVLLATGRNRAAEALVHTSAGDGPLTIRGLRGSQPCTFVPLLERQQRRSRERFCRWGLETGIGVHRASAACHRIVRMASHYWYRECEHCTSFQLTWPTAYGYLCDGCLQCHLALLQTQLPFAVLLQSATAPCPTRAPEGLGLP
jgi:hypothetical protein